MATILIADDSENIREFCRQELEGDGYRVLQAKNGKEAVDVAREARPDLVILDVWMPQASGFEAAERIAAFVPRIPVILFTNNDELCIHDSRREFAIACIEKSGDLAELKRAIVFALAAPEMEHFALTCLPPIQQQPSPEPIEGNPRNACAQS